MSSGNSVYYQQQPSLLPLPLQMQLSQVSPASTGSEAFNFIRNEQGLQVEDCYFLLMSHNTREDNVFHYRIVSLQLFEAQKLDKATAEKNMQVLHKMTTDLQKTEKLRAIKENKIIGKYSSLNIDLSYQKNNVYRLLVKLYQINQCFFNKLSFYFPRLADSLENDHLNYMNLVKQNVDDIMSHATFNVQEALITILDRLRNKFQKELNRIKKQYLQVLQNCTKSGLGYINSTFLLEKSIKNEKFFMDNNIITSQGVSYIIHLQQKYLLNIHDDYSYGQDKQNNDARGRYKNPYDIILLEDQGIIPSNKKLHSKNFESLVETLTLNFDRMLKEHQKSNAHINSALNAYYQKYNMNFSQANNTKKDQFKLSPQLNERNQANNWAGSGGNDDSCCVSGRRVNGGERLTQQRKDLKSQFQLQYNTQLINPEKANLNGHQCLSRKSLNEVKVNSNKLQHFLDQNTDDSLCINNRQITQQCENNNLIQELDVINQKTSLYHQTSKKMVSEMNLVLPSIYQLVIPSKALYTPTPKHIKQKAAKQKKLTYTEESQINNVSSTNNNVSSTNNNHNNSKVLSQKLDLINFSVCQQKRKDVLDMEVKESEGTSTYNQKSIFNKLFINLSKFEKEYMLLCKKNQEQLSNYQQQKQQFKQLRKMQKSIDLQQDKSSPTKMMNMDYKMINSQRVDPFADDQFNYNNISSYYVKTDCNVIKQKKMMPENSCLHSISKRIFQIKETYLSKQNNYINLNIEAQCQDQQVQLHKKAQQLYQQLNMK